MILKQGTRTVDDSLRFNSDPPGIWRGPVPVAVETREALAHYAKMAMEIQALEGPVAIIGLGTGVLPRLLAHRDVTVWELEPSIVELFRTRFPWWKGEIKTDEWHGNLDRQYIAIVEDTGNPVDREVLAAYLLDGGIILT